MKTKQFSYTRNSREISGFGGGYEKACRDMVIAGMQWLDQHPKAKIKFATYSGVMGLITNESPDCEKMQKAMLKVNDGCSGAQMQACLTHIMFAHKNGWDKYVKEMEKKSKKEKA